MDRRELVSILLFAAAIHLLILGPMFGAGRFGDDWQFAFDDPVKTATHAMTTRHPYELYRPVQLWIAAISLAMVPDSLVIAQCATLLLHLGLIAWIVRSLALSGVSRTGCIAAASFLVSSQLAANAVAANDTLSLVLSTTAGVVATFSLFQAVRTGRWSAVPLMAYLLALLGKESGLGYAPVLVIVALLTPGPMSRAGRLGVSGGVLVVSLLYLLWRGSVVGAAPPDSRLFGWGAEAPRNLIQLWLAATSPWSTTSIFTAIRMGNVGTIVGASVVLLGFLSWLAIGLRLRGRLGEAVLLAGLATVSVAPVLLMQHVSQLYAYSLLPALAVAVAWAAEGMGARRAIVTGLVFAALQMGSQWLDATAMASNGKRGERLMRQLRAVVMHAPQRSELLFVDRPGALPDYSVFRLSPFRLAEPHEAIRLERRNDLRWRVTSVDSLASARLPAIVVRVDDSDRVTVEKLHPR